MLSDFLTESVFTRGVSVSNVLVAVCFSDLRSVSRFYRRQM